MNYSDLEFKIPVESPDYQENSDFVVNSVEEIIQDAIDSNRNKIMINTNLKLGLPMENINKIAGPFIEAWAQEIFQEVLQDRNNKYQLIHLEAGTRLHRADVILQFKRISTGEYGITAEIDVKATAEDLKNSGKSPNITAFGRIRTAYIEDADYIFVILSLKHKVYSTRDENTEMMNGIMEVVDQNAYDLKFISDSDINYNPALGTGQLQIRDIHYVTITVRTTWELCQMLDRKFIASKKGFDQWLELAQKYEWIKASNDSPNE